jgi:hypothetical protein
MLTLAETTTRRIRRTRCTGPQRVPEASVRAACRLVRQRDAPDELVATVCLAALEAVRGHGGESARWLAEAMNTAFAVLDELAERAEEPHWRWLARRLPRW